MADDIVGRRLVFHIGGYDPMPPASGHRRFVRELRRFASTWLVTAVATEPAIARDDASWRVDASGPNWATRTDVRLVRWDDVIAREAGQSVWRRLPRGILALADFVVGGAFWGYCRRAWRYALFFLYPYLMLAAFVALATMAGRLAIRASGVPVLGWLAGALMLATLVAWAGRGLRLSHLLDDWIFSRGYLRHGDPVLAERFQRLAADLVAAARGQGCDEIVVVGHSLGAVLAVDLLDRALQIEPELGARGVRVALVTAGSSIPKLGLHRAAVPLRDAIARVASSSGVFWVEYQALTDAMNFYKTNPARLLGATASGPVVRIVRISRMLAPAYYRRIKRDFFRVHNQFVSANDQRALYDYFMICCGPLSVATLAASRDGAVSLMGPDGALLAIAPAGSERAAGELA